MKEDVSHEKSESASACRPSHAAALRRHGADRCPENANTTMAIMDAMLAARQHSVFYSHDYGSEVFSYDCYT
ncbi:MAG: hypothetical protein ACLUI3_11090 [Christensenellales bacterium]